MSRVTSVCNSPKAAYVESDTATTYPTPPTSTSTEFGRFSASLLRNCPIIARQYCRLTFACQTKGGVAYRAGKSDTPRKRAANGDSHNLTDRPDLLVQEK